MKLNAPVNMVVQIAAFAVVVAGELAGLFVVGSLSSPCLVVDNSLSSPVRVVADVESPTPGLLIVVDLDELPRFWLSMFVEEDGSIIKPWLVVDDSLSKPVMGVDEEDSLHKS